MFRPYCGEFLVSPFALHLGLNYCSHGCFYCFANLNQPGRRMDGKSIKRMLDYLKSDKATTIESDLLRQGMSVLIANDSDPCAASNAEQMLEALPILMDAGITFGFQTKGGNHEVEDLIIGHPPTMIYITFTSDEDDILRGAEPGAPKFEQRLDLARRAVAAGHFVIAGINPLIPGWWDDFPLALRKMRDAGIHRAWIGQLHLNSDQVQAIPAGKFQEFRGEILMAGKKSQPAGYVEFEEMIHNAGFDLYGETTREKIGFWRDLWKTDLGLIKTANCAIHEIAEKAKDEDEQALVVKFEDFFKLLDLPHRTTSSAFKEYIKPFRRTVYNATGIEPKIGTIREVVEMYWQAVRFPRSPIGYIPLVSWPVNESGERLVAKDGRDVIVVSAEPRDETLWPYHQKPIRVYGA